MGMKRFGRAFIRLDGSLLESLPGASIDIGGVVRTPVVGDSSVLGYTEAIKQSEVECEISLGTGVSLVELGKIADAVLTFEADTGQVYVQRGACLQDPPKATGGDSGKVPLKFFGQPAEEMGV